MSVTRNREDSTEVVQLRGLGEAGFNADLQSARSLFNYDHHRLHFLQTLISFIFC